MYTSTAAFFHRPQDGGKISVLLIAALIPEGLHAAVNTRTRAYGIIVPIRVRYWYVPGMYHTYDMYLVCTRVWYSMYDLLYLLLQVHLVLVCFMTYLHQPSIAPVPGTAVQGIGYECIYI